MKAKYTAHVFKDGDGWSADFPDVPGAMTCAETKEDVLKYAEEALYGVLSVMADEGVSLPKANTRPDESNDLYEIVVNL